MVSLRFILGLGVFVLLVAGAGYTSAQMSSSDLDPSTYKDHNEILEAIGAIVPEFGGVYSSNNGAILNIYLTEHENDPEKQRKTQEAIEELFRLKPGRTLKVVKGTYTMAQLSEWYDTLRSGGIWDGKGVQTTDLQEGKNRLYVGVLAEESIAGVQTFLDKVGIPREAVIIEVEEEEIPMSHTLRDRAHDDKMAGGYQVIGHGGACTIGFVAIKDGTAGMITAGHCTEGDPYDGGIDYQGFHQPIPHNYIGLEILDPPFSTSLTGCTDNDGCRHSDSAFIEYASATQYNLGWITKPVANFSIVVTPDTAHCSIVNDYTYAVEDDIVIRVGRTTGRRQGNVTHLRQ